MLADYDQMVQQAQEKQQQMNNQQNNNIRDTYVSRLGLQQHSPSMVSTSSFQTDRLGSTASTSTLNPHYKQEFLSKRNTTQLPDGELPSESSSVEDVTCNKSMVVAGSNLMLEKDTTSPKEVHRTTLIVGNHDYTDDDSLPSFGNPGRAQTVVKAPGRN